MIRSAVVIGFGRSGTSLVAGLLVDAGLVPGDHLIPPSAANATGFHEDLEVNRLNDELLAPVLGPEHAGSGTRLAWLARVDGPGVVHADDHHRRRMTELTARHPYVVKDPRLAATLDAWRPVLERSTPPAYVAVFRHPSSVVASIAAHAERDPAHFDGYDVVAGRTTAAWVAANRRLLDHHALAGHWAFVDADHLAATGDTTLLSAHVGTPVTPGRLRPDLLSAVPGPSTPEADALHAELAARAAADRDRAADGRWTAPD